ncbi:uncharacterized protein C8orf58 homolog isoform X4 [Opisthocomus hoazin]|uniref:uncharacterized protein C8orf58 homolog isoform X4 n=1 Tax=Opisthocomus hoazin TaxID=30419 RepID=UPI003F5360E7
MWGGSRAVWKRRFSCYGPWETAESCVVHTSASVYRRLQESPRQPPGGMSSRGPPPPPPLAPGSPSASGQQLLKSESEDSGVEMASSEHSPSTPLGSESSFSLDGLPPKTPPGEEPGPQPPRSRSGSKKPSQAAQRSRRQRAPGRCPRQLGRRSTSAAEPRAEPAVPVPGQGLRYLEHVCQMLERVARLQQDNRLLRQRAAESRCARPDAAPTRDLDMWRGERFRPRSCSDSQAPAPGPEPCRRTWGHSASSPSLLEPSESGVGAPTPDKQDGRSHWGRVKVLLTRLTRRSLRGGRCR